MPSAPSSADEMEAHLNELGKKFDRLKVLYEQYFMGIEKMEPLTARKEITRAIMALQQTYLRNTGLRFKASSLIQKWNIYQSYWNRTMRDIEAGRYVRHVATARRRAAQRGVEFPAEAMGLHLPERPPGAGESPSAHVSDLPFRLPDEGAVPLGEVLSPAPGAATPAPAPTAVIELPDVADLEAALERLAPSEAWHAAARPAPAPSAASSAASGPPRPEAAVERVTPPIALERSGPTAADRSAPVPSERSSMPPSGRSAMAAPSGRSERLPVPAPSSGQSSRAGSPQTPPSGRSERPPMPAPSSGQSSRAGSPQTPPQTPPPFSGQSSRASPEPARPPVPGLSEPELRALHQRILTAQQQAGERSRMRYDVLVSQLARQVPRLLQEYRCDAVSFDVITKDGKVRLKPRPGR